MKRELGNSLILMARVSEETLDVKEYLKLTPADKANIEKSQIIPPKLGEKSFGKIMVKYRVPVYR